MGLERKALLAALLAGAFMQAWAQGGIYTCVDAKGRRLTSDRPIAECMDREQRELGPNGSLRRTHGPSLTASERAAQEAKERADKEQKQQLAEEKRRNRLLLARYPNQAAHDRDRAKALQAMEETTREARTRTAELEKQRAALSGEAASVNNDPARMPADLRRRMQELDQQLAAQKRLQANQDEEKRRIEARFDEELARLKTLWPTKGQGQPAAAAATAKSKR